MQKKILIVFGTRPEAIKMASLVIAMQQHKNFICKVCVTAQHRSMLDQVTALFGIKADFDLDVMSASQTLEELTGKIVLGMQEVLQNFQPDLLLVHGDTTTTFASSLAAYYQKIPVGHVEAGLRTHNIHLPWPEEANRKLTASLSLYHFAPTAIAQHNLLKENVNPDNITVTGNTVIDALLIIKNKISADNQMHTRLDNKFNYLSKDKKIILVTGHRRENFGAGFENICHAIKQISREHPQCQIIYPVHLNPKVKEPVNRLLSGVENIFLIDPLEYLEFVYLMDRAYIILTDSGGVQEEAPTLGKPVLLMRDNTERPEAVASGTVKLVGTNIDKIVSTATHLIENNLEYSKMRSIDNPYGNGDAANKIIKFLVNNINEF